MPTTRDVQDLMWRNCGLLRDGRQLEQVLVRLGSWHSRVRTAPLEACTDPSFRQVRGLVAVGLLIARAALRRQESRGGHYRTDFPARADVKWQKHVADVFTRA